MRLTKNDKKTIKRVIKRKGEEMARRMIEAAKRYDEGMKRKLG